VCFCPPPLHRIIRSLLSPTCPGFCFQGGFASMCFCVSNYIGVKHLLLLLCVISQMHFYFLRLLVPLVFTRVSISALIFIFTNVCVFEIHFFYHYSPATAWAHTSTLFTFFFISKRNERSTHQIHTHAYWRLIINMYFSFTTLLWWLFPNTYALRFRNNVRIQCVMKQH